jgi:hypothetical protein
LVGYVFAAPVALVGISTNVEGGACSDPTRKFDRHRRNGRSALLDGDGRYRVFLLWGQMNVGLVGCNVCVVHKGSGYKAIITCECW